MQLKIGTYAFDVNSVWVDIRRDYLFNDAGVPNVERVEVDCEGYLRANGQTALTNAEGALVAACRKGAQDLILYRDDGGQSGIKLQHSSSLSGVWCVRGPSFTNRIGAEYATVRRYAFTFRADYPILNDRTRLVSWREKMSFSGGGPVYGYKNAINGPPQKQLLWFQVPYKLIQAGEAVGFREKPKPPPPAFPDCLMFAPEIEEISPDRTGDAYKNFGIKWTYTMESDAPLIAVPTLWR